MHKRFLGFTLIELLVCIAILAVVIFLVMQFFHSNYWARHAGGTVTIQLPTGQHLTQATWKDTNLWYLTRPREEGEQPTTWTFQESSSLGVLQGKVLFVEH